MAFQLEIGIPRHRSDRALEEGVSIVQKAGVARVLECGQSTASRGCAIDRQHLQAGLAEIGLQNKAVVTRAEHYKIKIVRHATAWGPVRSVPAFVEIAPGDERANFPVGDRALEHPEAAVRID